VHENLFQGCSGQGITLGSEIEVDAEGRPTHPSGGGGWVADRHDPCFPCEDPTTGDRPQREGGDEPPTRLQSEGDLYDIDIRRNRILDMGLDGIGVAHFFDLERRQQLTGLVRVEDLAVVENRIQRCVRRSFAPIPPNLLDLMAYGGIALSVVEGLVIRDNRIEDLGYGGLLPTCGIFVLYGEGVEIGRNHILNGGMARAASDTVTLAGRRGGIHVVYARSLEVTTTAAAPGQAPTAASLLATASPLPGLRRLDVALVVEENSVDVIRGQALSAGAAGPVSVVSNRLISHGLVVRDRRALLQPAAAPGLSNVLTQLGALVSIVTLGAAWGAAGAVNLNMAATGKHTLGADRTDLRAGGAANVLFDDNQCVLDLSRETSDIAGNILPPAIVIVSMDEVGFQDNQCECVLREGSMLAATLILSLVSQRSVSNRFKETQWRALFSAMTFALMNITAHNQANHCLWVAGPLLKQDQPNHILANVLQPDHCPGSERRLVATLASALG
jgi:hypothetical protein